MKVLITGGAGFIGHHMVEHFICNTDWEITILDRLSYAGDQNRIVDSGVDLSRIRFVFHDIRAPINNGVMAKIGNQDYIVHTAAETHVDRSLTDPEPFVYSNVIGTFNMLEFARKCNLTKYIQISTDEVYGPAPDDVKWKEWDRLYPSNPYSAAKAGGDCLAMAYAKSYGTPITITRTMNNFGERQHPEKFIPLIIRAILKDEIINIHGEKLAGGSRWRSGSRIWLHARNHADAVLFVLKGNFDELIINIAGDVEVSNHDMMLRIGEILGKKPKWKWFDFHAARPGHDLRYALDGSKLFSLGWKPPVSFKMSLEKMVNWTLEHLKYLEWE